MPACLVGGNRETSSMRLQEGRISSEALGTMFSLAARLLDLTGLRQARKFGESEKADAKARPVPGRAPTDPIAQRRGVGCFRSSLAVAWSGRVYDFCAFAFSSNSDNLKFTLAVANSGS
jgi:hypothetical protein